MEPLFSVENIHYNYFDRIPALAGIDLTINAGDRFAIIGANGSGKSTLLQLLDGLIFPSQGTVRFHGREVTEGSLRSSGFLRFFRERVGYVFQDSDVQLFCPTVLDELMYGPLQLAISEEEAEARSRDVLKMLNMEKPCRPPHLHALRWREEADRHRIGAHHEPGGVCSWMNRPTASTPGPRRF